MNPNEAEAIHAVHRLLFRALLEMRAQGAEHNNKVVFHLADLFHDAVLELERAARGECGYEDVMRVLRGRADEKGMRKWLGHNLAEHLAKTLAQTVQRHPRRSLGGLQSGGDFSIRNLPAFRRELRFELV